MASYINTNLSSMQAQRSLSTSQASLNSSIQRLSSGLRVNGAKDDAAGLAIATGMDKTVRGQTVAMRNANDAISFSQTTEGALGKISDTLQRMRELAVQSANGTNSQDQRTAMNTEFKELQAEITRVTTNTEFNGRKVLGEGSKQTFQIGAGTSGDNQIDIAGADLRTGATANAAKIGDGATDQDNIAFAQALVDFDASAAGAVSAAVVKTGTANVNEIYTIGSNVATKDLATGAVTYTGGTNNDAAEFAAALNASTVTTASTDMDANASFYQAKAAFSTAVSGTGVNISTANGATSAMDKIDLAIKEVNDQQTIQGAAQNRMASVISTLQVSNENQSAARSRIMDTDFASETANMARSQILQQASTAMLAQANQLPNGVMKLLG